MGRQDMKMHNPFQLRDQKNLSDGKTRSLPDFLQVRKISVRLVMFKVSAKGIKWPLLIRDIHAYAALSLTSLFLFFGLTGFMANRSEWFLNGNENSTAVQSIPAHIELKQEELLTYFKTMDAENWSLQKVDDAGEDEILLQLSAAGHSKEIKIDKSKKTYQAEMIFDLPAEYPHEEKEQIQWFRLQFGGYPENIEREDMRLSFDLESVWGSHAMVVDSGQKNYRISSHASSLAQTLINMHRSKHAGPFQKIIIDVTALILVFSTLTGAVLGIFYLSKKKRRWAIILNVLSLVLIVLVLIGR